MNPLAKLINQLKSKDGQPIEIPFEGTLPLLALGDIGLLLWREKRRQVIATYQKKAQDGE